MSSSDKIIAEGKIISQVPGGIYAVKLSDDFGGTMIKASLSGRMKHNKITVMEGDLVEIQLSPYDLTFGQITKRI